MKEILLIKANWRKLLKNTMKVLKINKYKFLVFTGIFFLISCSFLNKEDKVSGVKKEQKIKIFVELPDTISFGHRINGMITYNSEFDSIELGKNEKRYVTAFFTQSNSKLKTLEELKNKVKDTFVMINSKNVIPIYDIKLKGIGPSFLNGYILDEVFLEQKDGSFKISSIEYTFAHPVFIKKMSE
ncbi:hypothetical protein HX109_05580 [Galbibacter sp. BG1]|uniref:hypothetical protein n=1 Tax=Galbibacter sp. BG1 TaxID=1170699 RepID=UPI0015BFB81A|nr:hypothetical protein [Galbibacter sp. BG1]QLE01060.1 hypothetical protein HX109_05580 [Galbibacter sp. BG1]